MSLIISLIGGIAGAASAAKKSFPECWIFLVNMSFALYCAIFAATEVSLLIPLPQIPAGIKNIGVILILFGIFWLVLNKITASVLPNSGQDSEIPAKILIPAKWITGFLAGLVLAGFILFVAGHLPVISNDDLKISIKSSGGKTMLNTIRILNAFSFHSLTTENKKSLISLDVIYTPRKNLPSRTKEKEKQSSAVPEKGSK